MTAVEEPGRLPGGLSVWRGRLVLLRANRAYVAWPTVILLAYGVLGTIEYGCVILLVLAAGATYAAGIHARGTARDTVARGVTAH